MRTRAHAAPKGGQIPPAQKSFHKGTPRPRCSLVCERNSPISVSRAARTRGRRNKGPAKGLFLLPKNKATAQVAARIGNFSPRFQPGFSAVWVSKVGAGMLSDSTIKRRRGSCSPAVLSVSLIDFSPVSGVNHNDRDRAVIYGIDNPVIPHTKPK